MKIIIIGAYGFTGQLICKELIKSNLHFDVCGRNAIKINQLIELFELKKHPLLIGDIKNKNFTHQLIKQYDIFVNCAGPYNEESNFFLKTIAESGKIYLDLSGEVSFIKSSFDKYHLIAQSNHSTIIHGCAFESLPFDLLAQKYITKPVKNIFTFYWFNKHLVSPGTRITMKLAQYYDLYKINNSEWQLISKNDLCFKTFINNEPYRTVNYPLPEIPFFKWNYQPNKAQSFLWLPKNEVNYIKERNGMSKTKEETYLRLQKRKKRGPLLTERKAHFSKLILDVTFKDDTKLQLGLSNIDMYQTTALSIALSLIQILQTKNLPKGVVNPAKLFLNKEHETLNALNCKKLDDTFLIETC